MRILPSSVKGKLVLGFGTLIAITLGLGAAYHAIVVIDQAADEVGRRKILGCGDSADSDERVLEQFDTGKSKYAESTEKLPPFVNSEEVKRLVANLQGAHSAYLAIAEREVQLAKQ